MTITLRFEDGTVRAVSDDTGGTADSELAEIAHEQEFLDTDDRSGGYRSPAYRYADLRDVLDDRGADYRDHVLETEPLSLSTRYQLRGYQQDALDAWYDAGDRGVVELPTGAGKTVLAIAAMAKLGVPTLVVVPTVDLLDQWRRELEAQFDVPIGQFGGGEQRREAITVSTYDSAYLKADDVGGEFGFVVFDEVHHLGGEGYREIARLLAAPARLGLTATFERPDGAHEAIIDLVGPRVYALDADDLAGEHLADYEIRRIEVDLTPAERDAYEAAQSTFVDYLKRSGISMNRGSDYQELVKRSGRDDDAREALLAKQRARRIVREADRKVGELGTLLSRHRDDRVIVFTASTDLVYRLSERYLLPAITNETAAPERREILDRFRSGEYSRIVTANVLDEGVDVPDANVAVLLAGSGSEREFTQRLGRILRPNADGSDALLYEVVSEETAEERVAERRR